ncbi:pilus assembly protein CpaC [Tardiphaga alba]|uniref:Pilus assembly protein CpaC n=1 Tax=Tardiphaga alba TaxID=340268 RepID=A0ABX8AFQ6_9BRAD|nr:pilus assembly protein N-terminal domain-containing protein [Tardiphaga alba]QUS41449.1 pilus assembly protein CpaC [Tardiphaga alba]
MSFQSLRSRISAVLMVRALAAGIVLCPVVGLPAIASDMIAVNVDQAKLVKFPEKIATIVVGNPLIADVSLQPGGMVVVTGKGYGATNVVALDRAGGVLMDRMIQVEGPIGKVVTVYRGMSRESYSCAPTCERRVTLGDADAFFKNTMEQTGAIGQQALTASTIGKSNN